MLPEADGDIYRLARQFQADIRRREREASSALVRQYGQAWRAIRERLEQLHTEYEGATAAGERPPISWIYEFNRLRSFRNQIELELTAYAQYAEDAIRALQQEAIAAAELHAEALTWKALGAAPSGILAGWNRIDHRAVQAMLGMTRAESPLTKLLKQYNAAGTEAAIDALVQGMLLGLGPRQVAAAMRTALSVPLGKAMTLARTETLRAHREATLMSYQANDDLVKGWIWNSAASVRTCAACWAMHGTEHGLDERLDDHPNGRCSMLPLVRSWKEISERLDIDVSGLSETKFEMQPGVERFAKLSVSDQLRVLGPAKWAAWKDGQFRLQDVVGRKYSKEWGGMRYERSLVDMIGEKAATGYTRLAQMKLVKERLTADELIKVAGLGLRDLTERELQQVVRHVARAGFDPDGKERAGGRLAGFEWQGRIIRSNDRLRPAEVHYLRHVHAGREWRPGTKLDDYLNDLRNTVLNDASEIFVRKIGKEWQIGFVNKVDGDDIIFVEYRVSIGHWVTGFRLDDFGLILSDPKWSDFSWIRKRK